MTTKYYVLWRTTSRGESNELVQIFHNKLQAERCCDLANSIDAPFYGVSEHEQDEKDT